MFTDALGYLSARQSVNRRFYTTADDLSKVSFMPGMLKKKLNHLHKAFVKNKKKDSFVQKI